MRKLSYAAAAIFLAAGVGSAAAQTAPVELTLMTSYGPNQSRGVVLQKLADQFNTDHTGRIKVNVQVNPDHPAMQAKIRTMIAAGAPPDIFHYNYNAHDLSLPQSGQLLDFTPYMDDAWKAHFNQGDLDRFTVDGKLISIPFQQSPAMFYYDKPLLAKAGITEFPKTWNDLLAACDALQKNGTACISMFTKDDAWHASNAFSYVAACYGGLDVFNGPTLQTDAVVKAFGVLKQLFGYATKDTVGANYDVSSKNFLLSRTAMIIDGPWAIGGMEKQFTTVGDIQVAKAPTCDDAKAPDGFIVTDAPSPMAAGAQSDKARADAIAEWFKYFTSDASATLFAEEGSQPVAFHQTFDQTKVTPLFASYLAAASNAPGNVISLTRTLLPSAQTALPAILESLALDQISPDEAAQQLQAANVE